MRVESGTEGTPTVTLTRLGWKLPFGMCVWSLLGFGCGLRYVVKICNYR